MISVLADMSGREHQRWSYRNEAASFQKHNFCWQKLFQENQYNFCADWYLRDFLIFKSCAGAAWRPGSRGLAWRALSLLFEFRYFRIHWIGKPSVPALQPFPKILRQAEQCKCERLQQVWWKGSKIEAWRCLHHFVLWTSASCTIISSFRTIFFSGIKISRALDTAALCLSVILLAIWYLLCSHNFFKTLLVFAHK